MVSSPGQLSSDLLLLAVDPRSGRIRARNLLGYGLMATELVELAALGLARVENDRIVLTAAPVPAPVLASSPATGDEELDAALASIDSARRAPKPANWVGKPRRHIIDRYLARMSAAGIVGPSPGRRARWQVLDATSAATARSRLDALAAGSDPADVRQAALGGLVNAIGLDRILYPGLGNRSMRKRLRQIAKGDWTIAAAGSAGGSASDSAEAATRAAVRAATQAAVQAVASAAASAVVVP